MRQAEPAVNRPAAPQGRKAHVRHQTARFHHVARRRGDVPTPQIAERSVSRRGGTLVIDWRDRWTMEWSIVAANCGSREAGELAREIFCSRDTVLLSGFIVTLIRNNNVDRHRFLWPAELNANRNETLFPAACAGRINVHRRDVHVPPISVTKTYR